MSRIEGFEDMKASPYPPSPLTGEERDLLAALSPAMTEGRVETARLINRFIRCPRRVTNDC